MDKLKNPEYVFTNLNEFRPFVVISLYKDHARFSEEFILENLSYFKSDLIYIVKFKKQLSDEFFNKICNKENYSHIKCTRKLIEPFRSFKELDDKFY